MTRTITLLTGLHRAVFAFVERMGDRWLGGFLARFAFAAVLWHYFYASFRTKVGEGLDVFSVQDGAYYQIALPAVDAAGGDVSAVGFLPWGLIVHLGTYAEFALPLLLVLGLFTRVAALGMLAFIGVQTLVDITVHKVDAATIGGWFDRFPDALIADQRLLWAIPLVFLAIKGAGLLSADALLAKRFAAAG